MSPYGIGDTSILSPGAGVYGTHATPGTASGMGMGGGMGSVGGGTSPTPRFARGGGPPVTSLLERQASSVSGAGLGEWVGSLCVVVTLSWQW